MFSRCRFTVMGSLAGLLCALPTQAGLIDSAIRFWSFDGTLTEQRLGTGAGDSQNIRGYTVDRDGNPGGALDLRGERDAVIVDNIVMATLDAYSISLWFRMESHNPFGGRSFLFDTRPLGLPADGSPTPQFGAAKVTAFIDDSVNASGLVNSPDGRFGTYDAVAQDQLLIGANNGSWNHLLLSVENRSANFFYNGNAFYTDEIVGGASDFGTNLVFGDTGIDFDANKTFDSFGRGFNFRGDIDDVAIWNKALNEEEARSVFFSAASASVPTPSTWLLMTAGAIGLLLRHRNRIR